ncbi:regulator of sigma E protease [Brevundimonas bullata]|jgi:regulator of sigma E protease|uniref:Regulator of sigma E protease n=1 Tax=Brevundimonas bullata TaxID=13160 RepID=A0A7W7IP23_9CAUL|nr:M50 family metallopeptidase [Brevundimonas bullata]MBB4797857.1 regulator of sigma E protease [Brevundimonas bullata]MBB6382816.1 regulator of sigma E protease [Brevundimonas bullata]
MTGMLGVLGQALIYVVPFLLVLTLVVTIHELGHFLTARAFGVKMERFSIGFGRAIFQRTDKQGVEWRLGWLPLGGYVKFAGDLDATGVPDKAGLDALKQELVAADGPGAEKDYLYFKPLWQRALVVAGGPIANFVLAIVIFTLLFSLVGVELRPARVMQVQPDSPAATAGFQPGDLITHVNGKLIADGGEVTQVVALSSGDPVRFTVERAGADVQLTATPERKIEENPIAGRVSVGRIGLALGSSRDEVRHVRYGPIAAVGRGFQETGNILSTTFTYIGRIFTGRESGDQFSGPLGIAKASGALTNAAVAANPDPLAMVGNLLLTLTSFAAILSVGIGFLNLMPVPVLDGGHLMFYAYEAVARRPVAAKVQEAGYRVGLALLASLMLFATWNDLQKLNLFKFLGGLVS